MKTVSRLVVWAAVGAAIIWWPTRPTSFNARWVALPPAMSWDTISRRSVLMRGLKSVGSVEWAGGWEKSRPHFYSFRNSSGDFATSQPQAVWPTPLGRIGFQSRFFNNRSLD